MSLGGNFLPLVGILKLIRNDNLGGD